MRQNEENRQSWFQWSKVREREASNLPHSGLANDATGYQLV